MALGKYKSVCIRQLGATNAIRKSFYRYLNNSRVSEEGLIGAQQKSCADLVFGKELLILQDTTETNYEWNRAHIQPDSGLGLGSDNHCLGYFLHPSLVLDAQGGGLLGIGDLEIWSRPESCPGHPRDRRTIPIEQKESYRWISAALRCKQALSGARRITVVQDREGDQYESFIRLGADQIQLLTRCRSNRRLTNGEKLYTHLSKQEVCCTYELQIKDNPKRKTRTAVMELRFAPVQIKRPDHLKLFGYEQSIDMYGVYTEEVSQTVPQGEEPVRWFLLTTHSLQDRKDALKMVEWYRKRWLIEELFGILKTKGFNIERAGLENGRALRKLGIMAVHESVRILQLKQARQGDTQQEIGQVFDQQEQACLQQLNTNMQGATRKQQNPYNPDSLAWACWIIARLGGWTAYETRPPGVITLKRGLDEFDTLFLGWKLHSSIQKE